MANSVAATLNALARDSGLPITGRLQDFIADYFADPAEYSDPDNDDCQEESSPHELAIGSSPAYEQQPLPCDSGHDASTRSASPSAEVLEEDAEEDEPLHAGLHPPSLEQTAEVLVELTERETMENKRIEDFMKHGCNCCMGAGGSPCCKRFSFAHYHEMRCSCAELTREQKDLVIKAQVLALTNTSINTIHSTEHRHSEKERQREHTAYLHQEQRICYRTFLFLHGIGKFAFTAIKKSCREDCLVPRIHGNTKRAPVNALSYEELTCVVSFIRNYSEDHAIQLPGRIPGYKRSDLQLLPCSTTKRSVWLQYHQAMRALPNSHAVAYTTFCTIWRKILPNILPTRPMTDLCAVCHRNAGLIIRSSNLTEEQKSETLRSYEEHLFRATIERSKYREICKKTKKVYQEYVASTSESANNPVAEPMASQSCSVISEAHYSFDFAQQVHLPSDPLQPGPMYFLTPRKCAIFGVCCEGIPRQINYLIDEGVVSGKGANAVISLLHHFLDTHGLKEDTLSLNADNCVGQNKNNAMIQYLMWHVLTGRHKKITLSFLLVGHTKFSPDWGFGLLKQKFRRTRVSSLDDLAACVESSSEHNFAQLAGREDGQRSSLCTTGVHS